MKPLNFMHTDCALAAAMTTTPRSHLRHQTSKNWGLAEAHQHSHVEEMHGPEHDDNNADLCTQKLHCPDKIGRLVAVAQGQADEADIDEVKAHQKKVIH